VVRTSVTNAEGAFYIPGLDPGTYNITSELPGFQPSARERVALAGGGGRKLGVFVEGFNLFNTANFGGSFSGNSRSTNFLQPTDFVPGIGYSRQVQLGARFLF
jgi:hypothetical protein